MSINDYIPFDFFTTEGGGFALAGEAVRKSTATYDFYGNKDTLKGYIINISVSEVTAEKLASYTGTSVDLSKTDLGEIMIYSVRLSCENSPHAFLPEPCDVLTVDFDGYSVAKALTREHTFMLGPNDLEIGAEVLIKLDKTQAGSYNLRFGTFVETYGKDISKMGGDTEECMSAISLFNGASDIFNLDIDSFSEGTAAPTPLKTSENGRQFLIVEEGVRYQVYDDDKSQDIISNYEDAIGFPTIGVGHLIYRAGVIDERAKWAPYLGGKKSLTDKQVNDLLASDLIKFEAPGKKITKPVTQQMFDALVSLAYNAGPNSSAVRKCINAINAEDYVAAANAIKSGPITSKGKFNPVLAKRRIEETRLFLSGGTPKKGKPTT